MSNMAGAGGRGWWRCLGAEHGCAGLDAAVDPRGRRLYSPGRLVGERGADTTKMAGAGAAAFCDGLWRRCQFIDNYHYSNKGTLINHKSVAFCYTKIVF